MMLKKNYALKPFSEDSSQDSQRQDITVMMALHEDELTLRYQVDGDSSDLFWPEQKQAPERRDEIWQATCFEFFLASRNNAPYIELNFCPSGDWAAYVFDVYRGSSINPDFSAPRISTTKTTSSSKVLEVVIPWLPLKSLLSEGDALIFALTACLQNGGKQSFWSHAHAADQPDFHNKALYLAL